MPTWKRYHEDMIPDFPPVVKGEIRVLEEMELKEGYIYFDDDGEKIFVIMFRYPENSITKFTRQKGSKRFVKNVIPDQPDVFVDDRIFVTPNEGTTGHCYINYYVIEGGERKHSQCSSLDFAKLIGWKKGDGVAEGIPIPDTTPTELPPKAEVELERIRIEGEKEAAIKKSKAEKKAKTK